MTSPAAPAVLFEQRGPTAWVTINRPEAKNTMNAAVFVGLADAWEEVRANRDIRVAVLTGAGTEDFCCGGDLAEMIPLWTRAKEPQNEIEAKVLADTKIVARVMFQDRPMLKPVIGAFNGRALGGGCEIAQATDIRIAAEHAIFGVPEPKQGLVPGAGTMVRLVRQIGYANAMKMLLTAEPVTAQEAKEIGLISEVVSADRLVERAEEVAAGVAANAPLALEAIKTAVFESYNLDWPDAFAVEAREAGRVMRSSDAREGPRAFKERRAPNFTGD